MISRLKPIHLRALSIFMKVRLIYLLFLLISTFSVTPSTASPEIIKVQNTDFNYSYTASAISHSNYSAGKSIESKQFQNQNNTFPISKGSSTQIRWIQDATMNAPTIEVNDTILSLIEIIHLKVNECHPLTFILPKQTVLFKILFRVIISPNAP